MSRVYFDQLQTRRARVFYCRISDKFFDILKDNSMILKLINDIIVIESLPQVLR